MLFYWYTLVYWCTLLVLVANCDLHKRHNLISAFFQNIFFLKISVFNISLQNVSKRRTNQIIRSLLKTHFVRNKHIKTRRNIDEFFVSPEHLEKCSYEVLTSHILSKACLYTTCLRRADHCHSSSDRWHGRSIRTAQATLYDCSSTCLWSFELAVNTFGIYTVPF